MHEKPNGDHRGYRKTAMPGVYERGPASNPYWSVRYCDRQGKRATDRFASYEEACAFKARISDETERRMHRRAARTTFKEYAEAWPDRYRGRTTTGLREATRVRYRAQIETATEFFAGRTGSRPLAAVTPQDVERYVDFLFKAGHSPATVRRYMVPLRAMLAQAVREGLLSTNPANDIPLLPSDIGLMGDEEQEDVKTLTSEQTAALIGAVPARHRTLVTVIAHTGLRISEALGLRWRDIDRDEGVLRVRQAVVDGRVGPPKTKRSRRAVPVSENLLRMLSAQRLSAQHSGDDDLVFGTRSGQPVSSSSCYRWFNPAAKAAGVPWAGFHALRHSAASAWFRAGLPITVVSALLGHSTPSFTLSVYIHALPGDIPDGSILQDAIGL